MDSLQRLSSTCLIFFCNSWTRVSTCCHKSAACAMFQDPLTMSPSSFLNLPRVISLLSVSPPHKEMATWGRSANWSDKLSTPLSIPLLPTDCGDWLALRTPIIIISESPFIELLPPSLRRERNSQLYWALRGPPWWPQEGWITPHESAI